MGKRIRDRLGQKKSLTILSSRIDVYLPCASQHVVGLDSLQRGVYRFANSYIAIGALTFFFLLLLAKSGTSCS